jgi:HEAT repeat protein/tRNA A-37 threonylcarbamoyl transferase component Bud32
LQISDRIQAAAHFLVVRQAVTSGRRPNVGMFIAARQHQTERRDTLRPLTRLGSPMENTMNAILEHPRGSILVAYGLGQLDEKELVDVDAHLAECDLCRQVVEGVAPDTLLTLLRNAPTDSDSTPPRNGFHHPPAGATQELVATPPPTALTAHPRYRVGELLGVGGMGAVYKAEHLLMERPVALKVLNRKLLGNSATIERFRREVRAAARLTHPNIVAAFDAEQAGDVHFLAMEYVEGVSLTRRLAERGPLPVAEACDYIRQAAVGLQHAHERGMVHRDIKPQNLMLTPAGQVKILDFGLARFALEIGDDASLSVEMEPAGTDSAAIRLTHTGLVMGTPDYIAPEQARDSHLADIRSDIYSLGCTLYELLAGQAPFPDGNALHKVKGHLGRTPQPLDSLRRDVPAELVRIVERMMAKDPANRQQTPADVVKALTPFVAAPKPPRRAMKIALAAAAVALAVLLGGIIYVQTDRGRIVIETSDEKIAVMIHNAGGVKIVDQATNREYILKGGEHSLPSGEYQIEVTDPLAGLEFETKTFELKRGEKVRLTAKFIADGDGRKVFAIDTNVAVKDGGPLYLGKPASYWLGQLQDSAPQYRLDALEALGNLAAKNKDLVPVIVSVLGDHGYFQRDKEYRYVGQEATKILRSFGPEVLPVLLKHVDRTSPTALSNAGPIIQALGPKAAAAVPMLIDAVRMDDWGARGSAASALAAIGADAHPAIPALVDYLGIALENKDILDHLDRAVTETAVEVAERAKFKKKGGSFSGGFPDRDRSFRTQSTMPVVIVEDLLKIEPAIKNALPEGLVDAGENRTKAGINVAAPAALWKQAHAVLKAKYPGQPSPATNPGAVKSKIDAIDQAIRNLQPKGTSDPPAAQPAKDENFYQGKPASFWLNQLRDGDALYRAEAVKALGGIARVNKDYLPVLANSLKDTDDIAGYAASKALAGLDAEGLPTLLKTIANPPSAVALRNAIIGVGQMKEPPKEAVPLLVRALQTDDDKVCAAAIYVLGEIGEDAKAAMPALTQILGKHLGSTAFFSKRAIAPGALSAGKAAKASFGFGVGAAIETTLPTTIAMLDPEFAPFVQENWARRPGFGGADGTDLKRWQLLHDALKKKYPNAPAHNPLVIQTAAEVPMAPMPTPVAQGDSSLYLGKPADYWLNALRDAAPQYRYEAVEALGSLAKENKALIPVLVAQLKESVGFAKNNQWYVIDQEASRRLISLGPDVLPVLLERVDRNSPVAMRHAAVIAARLGPKASPAVPMLMQALKMDSWDVRRAAMDALAAIGADAKPALPAMVDSLGAVLEIKEVIESLQWAEKRGSEIKITPGTYPFGPGPGARLHLPIEILGNLLTIEPAIKGVLPKGMLTDRDGEGHSVYTPAPVALWKATHEALKKRYPSPQAGAAEKPKTAWVDNPNGLGFTEAGPWYLGKGASHWLKQLEDASPKFRLEAVEALGNIAKKNKSLIPTLVAALKDREYEVAARASEALRTLGPDAIPELVKHVDQKSPEAMRHAANAIGPVGPKGKAAVPMLTAALRLEGRAVHRAAADALARIGPDAKPAIPAIVDALGRALEAKEIVEQLESAATLPKGFGGPGGKGRGGEVNLNLGRPLPIELLDDLLIIDPEIKGILPDGVINAGQVRTRSGINMTASVAVWRQTHEALKKLVMEMETLKSKSK